MGKKVKEISIINCSRFVLAEKRDKICTDVKIHSRTYHKRQETNETSTSNEVEVVSKSHNVDSTFERKGYCRAAFQKIQ